MTEIYIRKATNQDLLAIMNIITDAKKMLKNSGSSQWQSSYPNKETISKDIQNHGSYVLIVDGKVAGTAYLMTTNEPTYEHIQGQWLNQDQPYATIHRIAIAGRYRGLHLSSFFFSDLMSVANEKGAHSIRFDTHPINKRMQAIGNKLGFNECGIIQVTDPIVPERIAFELIFK